MTTKQDKKAPKEKKETKLTKPEEEENSLTTAFYMLARVVDQNTQMFNALIEMMAQSEEPAKAPHARKRPTPVIPETPLQIVPAEDPPEVAPEEPKQEAPKQEEITREQIADVLVTISNALGVGYAKLLLSEFGAVRVSEVPAERYPVFLERAAAVIHKGLK